MPSLLQLTTDGTRLQTHGCRSAEDLSGLWADRGAVVCRGLYVHVPFCFHKCHYCDFYSLVDRQDRRGAYVARLIGEMVAAQKYLSAPVESIFFGGGTPTLLAPELWERLLAALSKHVPKSSACEVTVEANPETVTSKLLEVLVAGGVNRLSVGAQSFDPAHLETLERHHDPANVGRSVRLARTAGIENLNLDLIFAIPGQTLPGWRADLGRALELEPDHLSCYGLVYEPNTPMTARMRAGSIERADESLEADMYEATIEMLAGHGFEHYEISNWARPGRRCRHNLMYWTNESWWALGPSASGHVNGVRWKNVPRLAEYLATEGFAPITGVECLDEDGSIGEKLMLGLRLIGGIELDELGSILSAGQRGPQRALAIERHTSGGLLEQHDGCLRFTRRGLLLADTVLADLL